MRAHLGVGSNLGDRWGNLALAARELRRTPGLTVTGASRVYETEPLGPAPQPRYLNAVLELETRLAPPAVLFHLLRIEQVALRRRAIRWGARTLDLDLLLCEDLVLRTPELTVPHPALVARRFVLAPLAELCPDRTVPGTGATVSELLRRAPPQQVIAAGRYPGLP
jgi:2-amino-4-hydroxy-6-hydroxymethyldihydropteridine diphosphokinase